MAIYLGIAYASSPLSSFNLEKYLFGIRVAFATLIFLFELLMGGGASHCFKSLVTFVPVQDLHSKQGALDSFPKVAF